MNLIDDIDLEARTGWRVFARFAQLTHLFHAVVTVPVNFKYVQRAALGNLLGIFIVILEIDARSVRRVEALGKNSGDGGFAGAAWPAKQVRVGNAFLFDGVGQRSSNVFLSDDILKALRPIFSSD